jgi:phosphoglycerate dehydrogenase-like enzyme
VFGDQVEARHQPGAEDGEARAEPRRRRLPPHAAYYSEEVIRTVRDFAAHEVVRVLRGKLPHSPVNAARLADARR